MKHPTLLETIDICSRSWETVRSISAGAPDEVKADMFRAIKSAALRNFVNGVEKFAADLSSVTQK